ncbi:SPOSA6832_03853 [Sporobolomyces salmonicolor]|uniref:SPOSA6832_03853-mRNA-1:cds n=1 Tax=Sporidiobolus salmonicolor TaxID=5005 RepID=A0A0D6ER49_SPOSA|nr:SPOSA6832_03853 [Sporobolomyces salmonicolor]
MRDLREDMIERRGTEAGHAEAEYKVVVLGGGGVGKSALTVRFVHALFVEKYDPTIEDSYRRTLMVDGITVALEVLDTAGTEQFMSLHHMYIKSGDGFLLVFSLTSLESVSELHSLREQIQRIKEASNYSGKPQKVPIVLVGSKLDLTQERQVPRNTAVELSRSWGGVSLLALRFAGEVVVLFRPPFLPSDRVETMSAELTQRFHATLAQIPYYETSSRKEINVTEVFEDVTRQMIKAEQSSPRRRTRREGASSSTKRKCTIL